MIIDFHAHIYPEKIAEKATMAVGTFYGDAPMAWHGRAQELIESGSRIGVEKYIVHSVATKPEQVESINNFIISACEKYPQFIGFATMHQDFENFEAELDRVYKAGLRGLKLHPDFQKFQCDMEKMDAVYNKCAALNIPVLFHAGDCRYDFSGPARIAHILEKHPDLIVIAAHFGGYTEWDEAIKHLVGKNVYFDTSSTLWKCPLEKANKMLKEHGIDKFLFGSDFPMWDHEDEMTRFNKLDLNEEERQKVLYENGAALLKRIGA